jgi:GAF domain-containing protein
MAESSTDSVDRPNDLSDTSADQKPLAAGGRAAGSSTQISHAAEDELRESLAALSRLATGQLDLTDVLTRVADFAVAAIPGADGAGLTLLEEGYGDTVAASAPFVTVLDAIQDSVKEGPCITAAKKARAVRSGELSTDSQWPRFANRIAGLGVHSALSLPLLTPAGVLGAMTVYAHPPNTFDDHAAVIAELFAVPAAIAVQNAQVLAQTKRLAQQLQSALSSRAVIDQALGILMSRTGSTSEQAFGRLRDRSQADNLKLRVVAQRVVDEAVRRARARHTG